MGGMYIGALHYQKQKASGKILEPTKMVRPFAAHESVFKKFEFRSSCIDKHWVKAVSVRMRRSGSDLHHAQHPLAWRIDQLCAINLSMMSARTRLQVN